MDKSMFLQKCNEKFPCRKEVFLQLYNYIGRADEYFPKGLFVHGDNGTGKSLIIRFVLEKIVSCNWAYVNCIQCYSNNVFFENILSQLFVREELIRKEQQNKSVHLDLKCDNVRSFILKLQELNENSSIIICLDNAERIRNMDFNILATFLRLQEFTKLNVCIILISKLPIMKFDFYIDFPDLIEINFPQYSKSEIRVILVNQFESIRSVIGDKILKKAMDLSSHSEEEKYEILQSLETEFYEDYVHLFLNVFHRICRDLTELKTISNNCFELYCEPVLNKTIDRSDSRKLWYNIENTFKTTLNNIYVPVKLSEISQFDITFHSDFVSGQSENPSSKHWDLPYYTKYLLIAAYLASHNSPKIDKRFFVKNSGKQKKRVQSINKNAKVIEKMSLSIGPKSFPVDRLLAIFYAIIDEKINLTCNLLSQISSLIQLKFLTCSSGENNLADGNAKLQCTVNLDFILKVGNSVDFNVKQYLSDFI